MPFTPAVDGQIITATFYNDNLQTVVDELTPGDLTSYSGDLTQFRTQTDPGEVGTESLPSFLSGEHERERFRIAEIAGTDYWYETGTGIRAQSLATASLPSAGKAGRLAWVNNGRRGLRVDSGVQWISVDNSINVLDYGAYGDNSHDDTSAIQAAAAQCVSTGFPLIFPAGTYLSDNFTVTTPRFKMIGLGRATFKHTGTGSALAFDGSAGTIYGCSIDNITVQGNINTTNAFKFHSCHHMSARDLRARDCVTGFKYQWIVEGVWINLTCSSNEEAFSVLQPTDGIVIADSGTPGYYSTNNTFLNATIEGVASRGIHIVNGSNNTFIAGTSESNYIGVEIGTAANSNRRNRFESMWFEDNAGQDLVIYGDHNSFHDIYAGSGIPSTYNVEIISPATHNTFYGGYLRSANDQDAVNLTSYYDVVFPDSGSVGLRQPAHAARVSNCRRINGSFGYTGYQNDILGTSGTATPSWLGSGTGGTYTYGSTRSITWHRIGNICYCNLRMAITAISVSPTGTMSITGLPFTSAGASVGLQPVVFAEWDDMTLPTAGTTTIGGYVNSSNTTITLTYSGFGVAHAGFPAASMSNTSYISASFSYICA